MDHALLILYIIMVTVSGAGTAAALVLHDRLRTRPTLVIALVTLAFLVSLLVGVVSYYLDVVLPPAGYPAALFAVLGVVLGLAIYLGLLVLLRSVNPDRVALHVAFTALALVAQVGRGVLYLVGAGRALSAVRLPAIAAISAFLLYAGIVAWRARARARSATVSALLARLGLLLIVFAPLSTAFYALLALIPESFRPSVSLDFVFALGWSLVLISAFVRYLTRPEAPLEEGVPESFRSAYAITPREAEIIAFVAQGLSNQQIADRAFVSLPTVRTHLYNVFRKTGVRSRVDLVRLASGYRE